MTVEPTRFRAQVEYLGTHYLGFQKQREGQSTVQGTIEAALTAIVKRPVTLVAAGRTDSGVHARGQVIAFDLAWPHGAEALHRALNANLPIDIAIHSVNSVDAGFHPRYDARRRAYEYLILNRPVRTAVAHNLCWHVRQPLDWQEMDRAAQCLRGTHDFATFGQPPQGDNTVRTLFETSWTQEPPYLRFYVEANAFLYRMVRSLVGTLVAVGRGRMSAAEFAAAFAAADRSQAGETAPPQGLYLLTVKYKQND